MEFAQMHAGVLSPSRREINPYYVGLKIFEDIERRWDEPTRGGARAAAAQRRRRGPGQDVRGARAGERRLVPAELPDARSWSTSWTCTSTEVKADEWVVVEKDWEKVRDRIVAQHDQLRAALHRGRGRRLPRGRELYLQALLRGPGARLGLRRADAAHVHRIWGRPVHLETVVDDKPTVLTFDGHNLAARVL